MDKESITEYGYIIISMIVLVILTWCFTGSLFTDRLRGVVAKTVSETEQNEYENNGAFRDYIISRTPEVEEEAPIEEEGV